MTDPAQDTTTTADPDTGQVDRGPVVPRVQRPTVGHVVWYVDRQIPGSRRLAHVVGTHDSIAPDEGVATPSSVMHAHLYVTPPAGAAYHAHDVDYSAEAAPGTWRWPTRDDDR